MPPRRRPMMPEEKALDARRDAYFARLVAIRRAKRKERRAIVAFSTRFKIAHADRALAQTLPII